MSTFEANLHLRYGCVYIRLFAGHWHVEGHLDTPGDTYGLAVSYINAVALAMEAYNTSLLREIYPPFPADMMSRPSEQRPTLIEAEAHTVAERLVTIHQERDGLGEIFKSACHDSYDALN